MVEMARFQVGARLNPKDNRHKSVVRELEAHRKCKFYPDFHAKYRAAFNLPHPSPFEAPSKPLRSQDQDQEQDQDQDQETPPQPPADAGGGDSKSKNRRRRSSEGKDGTGSVSIPPVLDAPEFRAAWADWEKHRREIKKKLTPTSVERQLKKLAAIGVERAVRCIEHTIEKGWTGLREPDGASGPCRSDRPRSAAAPTPFEMAHMRYNPQTGAARDASGAIITDQPLLSRRSGVQRAPRARRSP